MNRIPQALYAAVLQTSYDSCEKLFTAFCEDYHGVMDALKPLVQNQDSHRLIEWLDRSYQTFDCHEK